MHALATAPLARRSVQVAVFQPEAPRPASPLPVILTAFLAAAAAFAAFRSMPAPVAPAAPAPVLAMPSPFVPAAVPVIVPVRVEPGLDPLVPLRVAQELPVEAVAPQMPAAREVFIEVGASGRVEDFPEGDEFVTSCIFGTPEFPYQVAGDSFEAVVDGRRLRVPYQPSLSYPGAKKAVIRAPGLLDAHSVVIKVVYDLGPDGLAPLEIENEWGGDVGISVKYRTAFGEAEATTGRARLRVK